MEHAIGPWHVVGTLGVGGMGIVYRAVRADPSSTSREPGSPTRGEAVAVKTTRHASPEESACIRSESRALSSIRHPGIVRIIDHGTQAGEPWYAMELLEGRTLRAFTETLWPRQQDQPPGPWDPINGKTPTQTPSGGSAETWAGGDAPAPETLVPIPSPEFEPDRQLPAANGRLTYVLEVFLGLCNALTAMHRRGLVHRDLKPENVFLRADGSPVLMDLGLVSQARGGIGREKLEEGGRILGTLPYMAPEQAEGAVVDARADIYSLGAMLYEALSGRRTLRRGNLQEILAQIRNETPSPPSVWVSGIPPELDQMVMRMLAKSPRERVGHADDVATTLAACGARTTDASPTELPAYLYRPVLRGRSEHRAVLTEKIQTVRTGKGGVAIISGESGAGKTFLAIEGATLAGHLRVGLITGECLPMDADGDSVIDVFGAPLHPFRKFLQLCADRARQRGIEYSEALLGAHSRILAPYEPALLETPSYAAHPAPEVLPAELARSRIVAALRATIAAWAKAEGPTVLMLDDLQWVDELSFAAISSLDADFLAENPVLFICTWRSDEIGPAHKQFAAQPHVELIELQRLNSGAVGEMVGDMLAMATPPSELVDFLARETEGNPFFVAEYLRMAVAEQLLQRKAGKWTIANEGSVQRLPSPGSLANLVSRRLGSLSRAATQVIEVAAVLGRHVRSTTLLGALTLPDADAAIAELETKLVLEAEAEGWRFVHDKLREAAFVRVPADRRIKLHRAAAEALEVERTKVSPDAFEWGALAYHWKEAKEPSRAVVAYGKAGDQALGNFSNREAREAYTDALELSTLAGASELDRARWEAGMADACLLSGETKLGMDHARRALCHAGFPLPTSKLGWLTGMFGQLLTRFTQAYWLSPFVVTEPAKQERVSIAARCCNRLLEPYFLANLALEGVYVGLRGINLAERIPPTDILARGLGFMSMLVGATPLRTVADRWTDRALKLAEDYGDDQDVVYVLNRRGCYSVAMGRWAEVEQNASRALQLATRVGDRRGFEEVHTVWAQALDAAGRVVEAETVSAAMVEAAKKRGDRETLAMGLVLHMDGLVRRARATDALISYQHALPEMHFHGEGIQAYFHAIAAEAKLQLGDARAARALADQALALLTKTPPAAYFALPTLVSTAHVYLAAHVRNGDAASLAGATAMHKWLVEQARLYPYVAPARDRIGGEIAIREGKRAKGVQLLRAGVESARALKMDLERAQGFAALARYGESAVQGESTAAAAHLFEVTGGRDWYAAVG